MARVSAAPRESGRLWHRVAVVLPLTQLDSFLEHVLPQLVRNETWYEGKRAFVRAARDAFFSYEGTIRQIYWQLREPYEADLRCAQPPVSFYSEALRPQPRPAAAWG